MTYEEFSAYAKNKKRRQGESLYDSSVQIWRKDGQETAKNRKLKESRESSRSDVPSYEEFSSYVREKTGYKKPEQKTITDDDIRRRSPTVVKAVEQKVKISNGIDGMVKKYQKYAETLKGYGDSYETDFNSRLSSSKKARMEAEVEGTALLKYINDNEATIPKAERESYGRAIGEILRSYKDTDSYLTSQQDYWKQFPTEADWGAQNDRNRAYAESAERIKGYNDATTNAEGRAKQAQSAKEEADRIRETNDRIKYQLAHSKLPDDQRKKWEAQVAENDEDIKNLERIAAEYTVDSARSRSLAGDTLAGMTDEEKIVIEAAQNREKGGIGRIIGTTVESGAAKWNNKIPRFITQANEIVDSIAGEASKQARRGDVIGSIAQLFNFFGNRRAEKAEAARQESLEGYGKIAHFLSDEGVSAIDMALDMVTGASMFRGGTSAIAEGGQLLADTTKGYQMLMNLAKSPYTYFTFLQEFGDKYEESRESGMSPENSGLIALGTGALNAAIEMGFGIEGLSGVQELPSDIASVLAGSATKETAIEIFRDWIMDTISEGNEEFAQKIVGDIFSQIGENPRGIATMYNWGDMPEFATTWAGGAFLGGVLGGGKIAVDTVVNTDAANDLYEKIMFRHEVGGERAEQMGVTQEMLDAQIESGMQSPEGTLSRDIAEKLAAKKNVSVNEFRTLSKANMAQIAEEEANDIGEQLKKEGADEVTIARAQQIVRQAAQGEEISPEDTEFALSNPSVMEAIGGRTEITDNAFGETYAEPVEASWRTQDETADEALSGEADSLQPSQSALSADSSPGGRAYDVNETGETTLKSSGESVTVDRIASTGNDMTVRLQSGETVKASDLKFGSSTEAYLYETFGKNEALSPNTATQFVKAYESGSPAAYATAMDYTFRAGRIGIPQAEVGRSEAARILKPMQVNTAYKLGQAARSIKNAAIKRKSAAGVTYDKSVDQSNLTADQKTQIKAVEQIAKTGGLAVRLYSSRVEDGKRVYTDSNGKTVAAPNGYFVSGTNEIYIDTEAGTNGEGKILFTLSHELTHYIKENNAKGFNALAEFLTKEYGGKGKSVSDMVAMQKAKARRAGRSISTEEAFEEFVADSMETMLSDGDVAEKIARLRKTDKSLADKIVEFFEKIKAALKDIMAKFTPDSEEGRFVQSLGDKVDELRNLFAEGVAGAAERFEAAEAGMQATEAVKKSERDSEGNILTPEQQEFFEDSKVRDEDGNLQIVYHGTGRADRVGTVFRADRATSGPMAFFTTSKEIAQNYAKDKKDTSIAYDDFYEDYHTQFRVMRRGKSISVSDLWNVLSAAEKARMKETAGHITMDDDWENVVFDRSVKTGLGNYDSYLLREHKGNVIDALIGSFLDDGNIYGNEEKFLDVLKYLGIEDVTYYDPFARNEKVYEAYLNVTKPFATDTIDNRFVDGFENWANEGNADAYIKESRGADNWDKNAVSTETFVERLRSDVRQGTTHAWTSIPDFMTAYLKENGYDGIKDTGGKGGGEAHTVWIPFFSNQIKSTENKKPTENEDIRFSFRDRIQYSPTDSRGNVTVNGDVSPQEVRNALQTIYDNPNGNHDYTIPVLKESPYVYEYATGIPGKRSFVMHASKAAQAMLNRNAKDHNLGVNGLMQVIGKLNDPDYIIYQRAGRNAGHYISIVTIRNREAVAAVDIGGYRGQENAIVDGEKGYYDAIITAFEELDDIAAKEYETFEDYILSLIESEDNDVVYDKEKDEESMHVGLRDNLSARATETSSMRSISQSSENYNSFDDISSTTKASLRNPTDAELIFNATGENVGEREQIASFKKTSLAYENAARSEAIMRVKVKQKKATPAELAEARRRTAKLKDNMDEERKALSSIVTREREKLDAADAEIGERIARGMESIRTQDQMDLLADIQRMYEGELAKADKDAEEAFAKGRLAGYDEAVAAIGDTLEKGQNAVEKIKAAETRTAKAEKARKDLVKLVATWKRDITGSRVTMPSITDVNEVAREIKADSFSSMKTQDIRAALMEMASMVGEADTTPIKVDVLFQKAKALAGDLVDNAVEVIDPGKEERALLKNYLMQNRVSVGQNANDLDPAFRKRNNWWLSKTGSGIDTVYRDLQETFGETRFPDAVNPADMAHNVEAALDSMSPRSENPWIGTEMQEKELLTNRIVESMVSGEIGFSYVSAKKLADELDTLKKQYAASKESFETEAAENAKNAAAVKTLQRELERVRERDRKAYNEAKTEIRTQAAEIRKLKTAGKKDAARIESYQERLKQKTVDKREAVKEATRKTKEKTLTNERERVTKNELRNKIRKIAHDLARQSENATVNKYIPAELKEAVLKAVDLIEPTSWKNLPETATMEDQMNRIHKLFADLRDNQAFPMAYDASIDRKIADCASMLSGTSIRKLSVAQLTEIHETLSAVVKMVTDARKLIGTTIEKDALAVSREMIKETASIKKAHDKIGDKWILTSITPESVFNRFGNYVKDNYWHRMWQMLDDGQTAETQILMEAAEQFRDLMNDKMAGRLRETVDIGLKDDNGDPILISRDMMLSVYMDILNEDNARHVKGGGYIVPNIRQYYGGGTDGGFGTKSVRAKGFAEQLDKAGMIGDSEANTAVIDAMEAYGSKLGAEIEKQLSDGELGAYMRKWIEKAQYFFDVWSKNHINETTMEYYGFEKAHVNHYFPIRTSTNYRATAFESIQMDNALESMGILKDRVQSSSPILLEGLSDVIASHARKVAQYSGLLIPTKNFEKIYGKTEYAFADSIKAELNKKFGTYANDYISKLMGDLTGTNRSKSSQIDYLRGMQAQGVLTLSPRVTMAQAASFPTAAAEVGWGPIMKALVKGGKNNRLISRADSELIAKYSPLLWSRMKGYAELNLGDLKNGYIKKEIMTKGRALTGWIQAVDGATVGRLWSAAEYYVQEKQPDLEVKSDDYYKEVAKVFNRIIERTQPDYDVLERPQILRGGSVKDMQGFIKQLTMFMTQRLQNNTLLIDGIENHRRINEQFRAHQNGVTIEDVQAARKKLAEVVTSRLVATSLITAMKFFADAVLHSLDSYRDDDGNLTWESVLKQLGYNFIETEISNFLWGSEIFSVISALIGKKRYYAIEFGAASEAASIVEEFVEAGNALTSGDTDKFKKTLWRFGKDVSVLLGIPVVNGEKIVNAFKYHIEDIKNGDFGTFEAGVERKTSQIKENLFAAYQYGDEEEAAKWEKALAATGKDVYDGDEKVYQARKEYLKNAKDEVSEAQIAYETGDMRKYSELVDEIVSYGLWDIDSITKSIRGDEGLYTAKDVGKSLMGDDAEMTQEIIKYLRAAGKDDSYIKSGITAYWKPIYKGTLNTKQREEVRKKMWETGLYGTTSKDKEKFQKQIAKWLEDKDEDKKKKK